MNDGNHIPEDDLVLFALQFLPADRMRETTEHLKSCELCRKQVAQLQGDLVAYAMTAETASPPAQARERLLRQVAKEPKLAPQPPKAAARPVAKEAERPSGGSGEPTFPTRQTRILSLDNPDEEPSRRSPRRAPWVLAWTGWAVAAGCSFVAGWQVHQRQQMQIAAAVQEARVEQNANEVQHAQDALAVLTSANAQQIALRPAVATPPKKGEAPPAATPTALAAYLASKGALVFMATHLQPVAGGKTYELWLLPADAARGPIPAGTFRPDAQGNASVVMPQLPRGVAARGFGVTVENAGGANTPTLPIVLSGA